MKRQCKHGWIDSYLKYTREQESPLAFHEWTAMCMLATQVGRRVWMDRGYYTIFPNLFVVLVASSATCRKSVSSNIGVNLLKATKQPPMIFSQKITNEALIQALMDARVDGASTGLVYASELSVFMGADATKSGLIPTLTDLYDSPSDWSYRTRGRGVEQLKNVSITVLAASTKEWLRSSIPADAVGGGFTSRIIFVCQERAAKPVLFPEVTPDIKALKQSLVHDLNEIREVRGPAILTPEAKTFAEDWYKEELFKVRDPKLEGYFGRKHDTMFKVAMLLSISEANNRIIEHVHIKRALDMLEENEKNLGSIIASVVATAIGGDTERVLEVIKRAGKIRHSDLLRKCWRFATAEQMSLMIKTLDESGEIVSELASDNRTMWYKAVQ